MQLIRRDSNPNPTPDEEPNDLRQTEFAMEMVADRILPEDSMLRVNFPRFGGGEHKRSDFAVQMNWIDVQSHVRAFIEMGHPDALYLQRLIRLAETVERAGWSPDDPPSKDFWEITPLSS